jgi:hypothetical protein
LQSKEYKERKVKKMNDSEIKEIELKSIKGYHDKLKEDRNPVKRLYVVYEEDND